MHILMVLLIIPPTMAAIRLGVLIKLIVVYFNSTDLNEDELQNSELVSLLQILSQFFHIPEHFALIYGIFRFLKYIRKNRNKELLVDLETLEINPTKLCSSFYGCFKSIILPSCNDVCPCIYTGALCTVVFTAGVFHIAMSFIPPSLLVAWRSDIVTSYNNSQETATVSAVFSLFSLFFNLLARVAMITITLVVKIMWDRDPPHDVIQFDKEYRKTGKFVASIQSIFQEWFVLKWIVYFLNIIGDSIIAIKVLFHDSVQSTHSLRLHIFIYTTTHLIYDYVAFTTIFICGTLMNKYHKKYYRKFEKTQISTIRHQGEDKLSTETVIDIMKNSTLNKKYNFIPSLCGLSFPLNGAGYLITFVLAIIGFVVSVISTFVDV